MSYTKTIVCLANSDKYSERCVAGIEVTESGFGGWIRPVSGRPDKEIPENHLLYQNGGKCGVLDIVKIPMIRSAPFLHQSENHIIDDSQCWEKTGEMKAADLVGIAQNFQTPIWPNCESTGGGKNDKIHPTHLGGNGINTSLALIQPETVSVVVGYNSNSGDTEVRAKFSCGGQQNILKITDPLVKEEYRKRKFDEYPIQSPLLTISLAEPWAPPGKELYAYKLVASLLEP